MWGQDPSPTPRGRAPRHSPSPLHGFPPRLAPAARSCGVMEPSSPGTACPGQAPAQPVPREPPGQARSPLRAQEQGGQAPPRTDFGPKTTAFGAPLQGGRREARGVFCQRKQSIYAQLGGAVFEPKLIFSLCGPYYSSFFHSFAIFARFDPILFPVYWTGSLGLRRGGNPEVNFVKTQLPSTTSASPGTSEPVLPYSTNTTAYFCQLGQRPPHFCPFLALF